MLYRLFYKILKKDFNQNFPKSRLKFNLSLSLSPLLHSILGQFKSLTDLTNLPKPTDLIRKLLDFTPVAVGGSYQSLKPNFGKLVGKLLHWNPISTDPIDSTTKRSSFFDIYGIPWSDFAKSSKFWTDLLLPNSIETDHHLSKTWPIQPDSFTDRRQVWKMFTQLGLLGCRLGTNPTQTNPWTPLAITCYVLCLLQLIIE